MKRAFTYLATLLVLAGLSSCHDFLTENTGDLDYVRTVADLDELLVGDGYIRTEAVASVMGLVGSEQIGSWIHCMDDDVQVFRTRLSAVFSAWEWHYRFSKDPFIGCGSVSQLSALQEYEDRTWNRLYKQISIANLVIGQLDDRFRGDPRYNRIKGEALFLRGQALHYLVNCYAKPYTPSTAATDPGIPLKLTAPIEDRDYRRNSVAEVYERIVLDLAEAAELMEGIENRSIYRAGPAAAHALLSRTHLYMQRWDDAVREADLVLRDARYGVYDLAALNADKEGSDYQPAVWDGSPEVIFTQGPLYHMAFLQSFYVAPQEVYELFGEGDVRRKQFTEEWAFGSGPTTGWRLRYKYATDEGAGIVSNCLSIRLPEVVLNKAEALAHRAEAGDEQLAAQLLADLAARRLSAESPTGAPPTGAALIDAIRLERRKELFQEGHRWFDLKRYAVQEDYPLRKAVAHKAWRLDNVEVYEGEFILPAYDPAAPGNWLLPIPRREIEINHGAMTDNPRTTITATK